MTQSSIDALKCRIEYVNTTKHYKSNGVGHQQRILRGCT